MLPFLAVPAGGIAEAPHNTAVASVRLGPYPQLVATRYTSRDGLPEGAIARLRVANDHVVAISASGAATGFDGKRWTPTSDAPDDRSALAAMHIPPEPVPTSWARAIDGTVLYTTVDGLYRVRDGRSSTVDLPRTYRYNQPTPNVDTRMRAVTGDGAGHVWIASDQGAYLTDGADWWHPLNRKDGMPYENLNCIALAKSGDLWGGTSQGAWRLRAGQWRYFAGPRWLPGNAVSDIALGADGSVWLATDHGVAHIEERTITLADKAAHYEEINAARHDRRGWVTGCGLKVPGDPSAGFVPEASDNDGLWTAVYVAAESFQYASTKDPVAHTRAQKSMNALLDLVRLSGYPGFPARAIVRKGENASGYDPNETVRIDGEKDKIWYTSPADSNLLCKGDTSSDELDGHYFAWYVYHDLVADDQEKGAIRKVVASVTDNLLSHHYTLVGHTGRKTRWGVFGPQFINDDPRWFDERGLNSSELLCYLSVAYHICGDKRYRAAYDDLIEHHHYLVNTLNYRRNAPWYAINHSDDELAYCVYYPLLMLEHDPGRHAILEQMIASTWNGGTETAGLREENAPFYSFIFGACSGSPCRAEQAVQTLQDWPWELVNWDVRNSHRHDVQVRTAQGIVRPELDCVLPASERALMRWNGNPWTPDGGEAGRSEEDGSAWLLPYWMGRYHGIIEEAPRG